MKRAILFVLNLSVISLYLTCSKSSLHAGQPTDASRQSEKDELNTEINQITEGLDQASILENGHQDPSLSLAFIPYRSEKGGKAAFYDHYTFQKLTGHGTLSDATSEQLNEFRNYLSEVQVNLLCGDLNPSTQRLTPFSAENHEDESGLLLIPGRARANEFDQERTLREDKYIQKALNRGQPILAICAGCTQLWEKCGGKTERVTDHNYNGGMLRLGKEGRTVFNVQIHNVVVQKDSLLSDAMGLKDTRMNTDNFEVLVNSVHWKSPDESSTPSQWLICARAKHNPEVSLKTRHSTVMAPQEDTVEAFESRFGAPVLGIQWHPEAYNPDDLENHGSRRNKNFDPKAHIQLLCYMSKSGDAYRAKRKMLQQLLSLRIFHRDTAEMGVLEACTDEVGPKKPMAF